MENLVEIFANTLDAILGIVFLTMILGKKKSMSNWLFVVLALIVPVANVVLQKVFPDSPENNIVHCSRATILQNRCRSISSRKLIFNLSEQGFPCLVKCGERFFQLFALF